MTLWHRPPVTVRLAHAIERGLGVAFTIEQADSADWASATFAGATHRLDLVLHGENAERRADQVASTIADTEYELRGHIVADITLAARERCEDGIRLTIEALTIVDA